MNDEFIAKAAEALDVDQETVRDALASGDVELQALLMAVVELDQTHGEWKETMARHRAALVA